CIGCIHDGIGQQASGSRHQAAGIRHRGQITDSLMQFDWRVVWRYVARTELWSAERSADRSSVRPTFSDFIQVVDQYTGRKSDRRYTVSDTPIHVTYPLKPIYTDDDILTI